MKNHNLLKLLRSSRLSQTPSPISKDLRTITRIPTHQTVICPFYKSETYDYGLKSILPKKVGTSPIIYNDLDNYKGMQDYEIYSGKSLTKLKFQESQIVPEVVFSDSNPLFYKTNNKFENKTLANKFGLDAYSSKNEIKKVLDSNKNLSKDFRHWIKNNHSEVNIKKLNYNKKMLLVNEFLQSYKFLKKKKLCFKDFYSNNDDDSVLIPVQGTGGLSYNLKGRLVNSPHGVVYDKIVRGRFVSQSEVAALGFIGSVNQKTTSLQYNFVKNHKEKNTRQFVVPFKVDEVKIDEKGTVNMFLDGLNFKLKNNIGNIENINDTENSNFRNKNENMTNINFKNVLKDLEE